MSEIVIAFSFISLVISVGVLWFVAEMMRRMSNDSRRHVDERFTGLLADIHELEAGLKELGIKVRDISDATESVRMSQQHSAGKEQAITASLKEVAKQINSLESVRQKATGTKG